MSGFKYAQRKKIVASSLKEKRKKRRIFLIILLFCLTVFIIYVFIFSAAFKINKIEIKGEKSLAKEEISVFIEEFLNGKVYKIFPLNDIFVLNSDNISIALQKKFPVIENVSIYKKIPHRLEISLIERTPIGIWCGPSRHIDNFSYSKELFERNAENYLLENNILDKCFYVDSKGIIFTEAPISSGGLILNIKDLGGENSKLGDVVLNDDLLKIIITLKESLYNGFGLKINEFRLYPEGSSKFEVFISEGWKVIFDPHLELSKSLVKLNSILNEEIKNRRNNLEYVDLSIGNKVYYKYKNGL